MAGQKRRHVKSTEVISSSADADARQEKYETHRETSPNGGSNDGWEQCQSKSNKKFKKASKRREKNYPSIVHSPTARLHTTVKISDLQRLILYILADAASPTWVAVRNHTEIRRVVVVMVPGLEAGMFNGQMALDDAPAAQPCQHQEKHRHSPDDYYPNELVIDSLPDALKPFAKVFPHVWPIRGPGDDRYMRLHSPLHAILTTPVLKEEEGKQNGSQTSRWQSKRTPITQFVATLEQMREDRDEWTIHPAMYTSDAERAYATEQRQAAEKDDAHGWVDTPVASLQDGQVPDEQIPQGSVTAGRKVLALDCEMCKTGEQVFELTRISVVDWDGHVLLDELVKPERPIIDYLTPYSGMTEAVLEHVTTTLADIQTRMLQIITPQTILVGHSINSDLNALQMTHPFVVDTSLIYPHARGPPSKCALKWLAHRYLSREIQQGHGTSGHDSIEDARAALELVKQKCENGERWGVATHSGESIFKRLHRSRKPRDHTTSAADEYRTGAVVDWTESRRDFATAAADVYYACSGDDDVVANVLKAAVTCGRGRGVDFVWARMRELEAARGWWSRANGTDADDEASPASSSSSPSESNGDHPTDDQPEQTTNSLAATVGHTARRLETIYDGLPPCSAFIVYSGSGDSREVTRLQDAKKQFYSDYRTMKWSDISQHWTDADDQALREAYERARAGVGFMVVK